MPAFRDDLLADVDDIRGIPVELGLRLFSVTIRTRTWSGSFVGQGTKTDVDTGLKIDLGVGPVKARMLQGQEIVAAGGAFNDELWEVGPITPPYSGSASDNDAISVWDPPLTGPNVEIFYRMTGPGFSASGDWFRLFSRRVDQSFRYTFLLKKTEIIP